jgi:hypothetical protein
MLQKLNYTESPTDIPNPERGFERSNDDAAGNGAYSDIDAGSARWGYLTLPVDENTVLGQEFSPAYEMTPPYYLGGASKRADFCNVPVEPRIIQMYVVLNNYSSNAWCQCTPGVPGNHTRTGIDAAITPFGLNYLKTQLEFIRNHTNSTAHIRVCYDPKGWNAVVWTADNLKYDDGLLADSWHQRADYSRPIEASEMAAHIAKKGAGTWRGASPVFRQCNVAGYEDINWVQYHYRQLRSIFAEYSDIIWAFDSGTFGPWGETHSSYEAERSGNYKMLLDELLAAVPDGKPIMTHIGGFLDWYNKTYNTTYTFGTLDEIPDFEPNSPEARFGMFSDSVGWSADEYSYGNGGSLTEGYRMLAHDPAIPGYNENATDPSLTRAEPAAPGGKVGALVGCNDSGTNRLLPIPEEYNDTRWRGAWFADFDRSKVIRFIKRMAVYGGEVIGVEPAPIDGVPVNGALLPPGKRINNPQNSVILRFPYVLHEASMGGWSYMCIQQAHGSFKSRADFLYTCENIQQELTLPWSGEKIVPFYDPLYEGQSALAYYRDRMGFRLILREAHLDESVNAATGTLTFNGKIQNVGWGRIFNKKRVTVLLAGLHTRAVREANDQSAKDDANSAVFTVATDIDPRLWLPAQDGNSLASNKSAWHDVHFSLPMHLFGNPPAGEYNVYLKINDPKETTQNKRSIRFANHDIWNERLGANFIGSIYL